MVGTYLLLSWAEVSKTFTLSRLGFDLFATKLSIQVKEKLVFES